MLRHNLDLDSSSLVLVLLQLQDQSQLHSVPHQLLLHHNAKFKLSVFANQFQSRSHALSKHQSASLSPKPIVLTPPEWFQVHLPALMCQGKSAPRSLDKYARRDTPMVMDMVMDMDTDIIKRIYNNISY